MTNTPRPEPASRNPIARFFGQDAATGSPFDLLGIAPDAATDEGIVGALHGRLRALAAHVETDTPEADEVRLAMHAAAAQLLDPHVRRHMLAQWGGGFAASLPGALEAAPATPNVALEHDVLLTLALHGGWNGKALHRLMTLAQARGLSSHELAAALRELQGRSARPTAAPHSRVSPVVRNAGASGPADRAPHGNSTALRPGTVSQAPPSPASARVASPADPDPAMMLLKRTVAVVVGGAVLIATISVAWVLLSESSGKAGPEAAPPVSTEREAAPREFLAPPERTTTDVEASQVRARPTEALAPTDAVEVSRRLTACIAGATTDPVFASAEFAEIVSAIRRGWPTYSLDQLVSINHGVVEFMYRVASSSEAYGRAIDAIADDPAESADSDRPRREVWSIVWSCGMLARLSRERDLPATVVQRIRQRLGAIAGDHVSTTQASFESGARAAMQMLPTRLAAAPVRSAAWEDWIRVGDALFAGDARGRARALLAGLEVLLSVGPDPSKDGQTFRSIRALTSAVPWRAGDESRAWLIARFDDPRIDNADLHTVTSALAATVRAENVDVTMVLPVLASESVRTELRDRYTRAWALDLAQRRDELTELLVAAAAEASRDAASARSSVERLAGALVFSRLSEAARWIWRGRTEEAARILSDVRAGFVHDMAISAVTSHGGSVPGHAPPASRGWMERYLAAGRNIPVRLSLLDEIEHSLLGLSPDAEILVQEAIRGSPVSVRMRAREIVFKHSSTPGVVAGMLEALPMITDTGPSADLVQAVAAAPLPPASDPRWKIEARRALVVRLLELLSAEGEMRSVDRLSELLAASYAGRVSDAFPLPTDPIPPIETSASRLWLSWQAAINPGAAVDPSATPPEVIERRRTGRLALASGLVQVFAAHQVSVCELMAYVVAQERPHLQPDIKRILDTLGQQRRTSTSILRQIHDVEHAMLHLWLLRLGETPP